MSNSIGPSASPQRDAGQGRLREAAHLETTVVSGPLPARRMPRSLSILASVALLVGMLATTGGSALGAGPKTCWVKNTTLNTSYNGDSGSVLQTAITAAGSGDTLEVRGRCVGNFRVVAKTLTLVGKAKAGSPVATLDANSSGRVVLVEFCGGNTCTTDLTLTDLLITGGAAEKLGGGTINDVGGGIFNNHSILTLNGSTQVRDNRAAYGGGIASFGTVILNDSVQVTGNAATLDGGGIWSFGDAIRLNGAAQVTGNVAGATGGGIYQFGGSLTMDGTSEVTGNTAGTTGGGIWHNGTFRSCDSWTGAISPNTPDDPPAPTPTTC